MHDTAPEPAEYPTARRTRFALLARLTLRALAPSRWRILRFVLTRRTVAPRGLTWRLLFASRWDRLGDVDIVHAHFGQNGVAASEMKRRGFFDAPLICTFHGKDALVRGRAAPPTYEPLRDAAAVTVTTRFMRSVVADLGLPAESIRLWPQGVDTDVFRPRAATRPSEYFEVLTVARLVPFKAIDIALHVVAQARESIPQIRYTVIGEGDLRPSLERLATELGIADITTLAGALPHEEVLAALANTDLYLHMGRFAPDGSVEAFGVAPLEAAACGLPVVASGVGGLAEIVVDGETGYVVPPLEVERAAEALVTLARDPALRARMGVAGRALVEQGYALDVTTGIIEDVYRKVVL
ncbi:MAG: glycosyltransferase [Acidimicrobiales bacterium]|nr:glycosyltransferase [Acidimicrobiales bacterium]